MAEVKSEKALGVRDGTLETEKSSHLDAEGRATKPEDDPEDEYPRGLPFVLLTIGLMAVVLVVALDNYIICMRSNHSWFSSSKMSVRKHY